jgi:hypothetical protein
MTIEIGLLIVLAQLVFGTGLFVATMRNDTAKAKQDVNNLGKLRQESDSQNQRRWLHMIATQIETAATLDEAKLHAKLLREDAWRK